MKQTKQFLRPLLMAIVMLVGMLVPQGAWAAEEVTIDGITFFYDVEDDGITISDCESGEATYVEVPAEINGTRVTKIGDVAFSVKSDLRVVVLPASITTLGGCIFGGTNLVSLEFKGENPPTYIDYNAFEEFDKSNLSIVVPEGSVEAYQVALSGWFDPEKFVTKMPDLPIIKDDIEYRITDADSKYVSLFKGSAASGDITITATISDDKGVEYTVTEVAGSAFETNEDLTSVTIPSTVQTIGNWAFFGCSNLATVTLSEGVHVLGTNAFRNTALTFIVLPASLTSIDLDAFSECNNLGYMVFKGNKPTIGSNMLNNHTAPITLYVKDVSQWDTTDKLGAKDECKVTYKSLSDYCTDVLEGHQYNDEDVCTVCGLRFFDSTEELMKAGIEDCNVTVKVDDMIIMPMQKEDDDEDYSCVILSSGVRIMAPTPESDLNWEIGGTLKGTLTNVRWNAFNTLLLSEDVACWNALEYTAPVAQEFASMEALMAADLTPYSSVTVTINGTISSAAMGEDEDAKYVVTFDNGFTIIAMCDDLGWASGGTVTGKLTDVLCLGGEDLPKGVGVLDGSKMTTELTYKDPVAVTVGETEIEISLDGEGNYVTTQDIVLTDGAGFASNVDFTAPSVTYERTLAAGKWGTLCLPYALSAKDGYEYYELSEVSSTEVTLSKVEGTVPAGKPVMVRHSDSGNLSLTESNVLVKCSTNPAAAIAGLQLMGTYVPQAVTTGYYLDASDNTLYSIDEWYTTNGALTIPAFRAWFGSTAPSGARSLGMIIDDETSSLDALRDALDGTALIYGLDGQLRSELREGVNVVNGKKVILK